MKEKTPEITNSNKLILAIGLLFITIGMFYNIAMTNVSSNVASASSNSADTNGVVTYDYDKFLNINGKTLKLKIADDQASRVNGLSGTSSLCAECSMLFIFDKAGFYNFWMKDMNYDIDIVYIGEDMRVIDVYDYVLKSEYPKTYTSNSPAKYVLELPAGKSQELNIKEGDRIEY